MCQTPDCLGFYNETTDKWECEDPCPVVRGNQICGKTPHLTNFAMLLQVSGTQEKRDPCGSSISEKRIYEYLTLSFVLGACCCCLLASFLIEIKIRIQSISRARRLREISRANKSEMAL